MLASAVTKTEGRKPTRNLLWLFCDWCMEAYNSQGAFTMVFLFCCRCESVLKPGMNCSIRVTRPKKKRKAGKYGSVNNITYICHFCKKGSATPGTPKEHVKTKRAQAFARARLTALGSSQTNVVTDASKNSVSLNREREIETNKAGSSTPVQNLPKAPEALLLSSSSTKKRKRKGWATLKDLTLSS